LSQTPRSEASLPSDVRLEKGVSMATSVHLLKLFVGLSTVAELATWQKKTLERATTESKLRRAHPTLRPKRVNVASGSVADGLRLQISDCGDTAGQVWGLP
jgi:hypothetical protein